MQHADCAAVPASLGRMRRGTGPIVKVAAAEGQSRRRRALSVSPAYAPIWRMVASRLQLEAMPLSAIARRYGVSIEHAGRMKRKTLNAG